MKRGRREGGLGPALKKPLFRGQLEGNELEKTTEKGTSKKREVVAQKWREKDLPRRGHSVLIKAAERLCRSGTKNGVLDLGTRNHW